MHRTILAVLCVLVIAPAGCDNGEIKPQITCVTSSTQMLRVEDATPQGFSALDVIQNAVGSFDAAIAWADSMSGSLEVSLEIVDMTFRFEERAYNGDPGPGAVPCEDALVIDMNVVLASEEGRLNDLLSFQGFATTATALRVAFQLPSTLNGTFDIADFAPSGASAPRAVVDLTAAASGVTGSIDGFAGAEAFDIGTVTTP